MAITEKNTPTAATTGQGIGLLTATWARDSVHFELLRKSIMCSALSEFPHYVVVQTEDIEHFKQYKDKNTIFMSTAEVLPPLVEAYRRRARILQERFGRTLTRIAGSCSNRIGIPIWPRYTGWHTQQLVKFFFIVNCNFKNVVMLDSDVLVTSSASIQDFLGERPIICYRKSSRLDQLNKKITRWNIQAWRLFDIKDYSIADAEAYFDTPFIMHADSVRSMCEWLEKRYRKSWWNVLIEQPVRQWSEFGLYRVYLRWYIDGDMIEWRSTKYMHYIFDVSDTDRLAKEVEIKLQDPLTHYITLHSQNSGRQLWDVNDYASIIHALLERHE